MTAVQLAAGYAAIGNGGTLVTPHVVAGWTDADGTYHDATPPGAGAGDARGDARTPCSGS